MRRSNTKKDRGDKYVSKNVKTNRKIKEVLWGVNISTNVRDDTREQEVDCN